MEIPGVPPGSGEFPPAVMQVRVRLLHADAVLPSYALPGDAGADLTTVEDVELGPGERRLVSTGLAIEIPPGYAAFVHPRSGLAARSGLSLVNTPGTIDAGYRGEVKVNLINHDRHEPVRLRRGDRIAQLVVQRVEHCQFLPVDTLSTSQRSTRGHGSTGGSAEFDLT